MGKWHHSLKKISLRFKPYFWIFFAWVIGCLISLALGPFFSCWTPYLRDGLNAAKSEIVIIMQRGSLIMIAISLTIAAFIELGKMFFLSENGPKPRYGVILLVGAPIFTMSIGLQSAVISNNTSNGRTTALQVILYIAAAMLALIVSMLKQTEKDASEFAKNRQNESKALADHAADLSVDSDGMRI